MAFIPNSNSVVAFQSDPNKLVGTFSVVGNMNSSVHTYQGTSPWIVNMPSPSVIAYQAAGSILAVSGSFSSGNTSVTAYQGGAWSTSITGGYVNVIGSVLTVGSITALQGTNPWIVNQPSPSIIAYQAAGSIMAVSGSFTANPQSSIIAIQLAGSIMAVSATVNTGNSSVQLLGGVAVIGSVAVLQGTNPWQVNMPSPSVIAYQAAGSIMAISGSFSAGNTSVTAFMGGSWSASVTGTMSVIGTVPVTQSTTPWIVNMPSPSVIAYQAAGSIMAISGSFSSGNTSVTAFQGGAWTTSVVGGVSILGGSVTIAPGANVIGAITTIIPGTATTNLGTAGAAASVSTKVGVLAMGIRNDVPTTLTETDGQYTAGLRVDVRGAQWVHISSTEGIQNIAGSIIGTYSEDAGHTTGDKGLFMLGVRNDAVSSITNAENDYSPHSLDDIGRTIIKPFAGERACIISYVGSVVSGSVTLIQPSVIGSRSYITDFWVTNTGATTQLITFKGGDTSLIGYTIAPAGGGSNSPGIAIPLRTTLSQDLAWQTTGTSSVVYLTVKGYQAP